MGEEVQEREEDRERFLHSQESVEWPFPVELDDRFVGFDASVSYYVLAGIVAFCRAVPEEEAMEERCRRKFGSWFKSGHLDSYART